MAQPYVVHTIIDFSGETATVKHYLPTISNANYANITGNVTPGVQSVASLRLALAAITNGNFVKHTVVSYSARNNTQTVLTLPNNAQRENKLLVLCRDDTLSRRFSFEIAAPNLTLLAQAGTDEVNMAVPAWVDFADWLNTNAASPWGNSITVLGGRLVGRSI